MNIPLTVAIVIALVVIGITAVVLGEADDSPGLQGLGVLLVVGAITLGAGTVRRSR